MKLVSKGDCAAFGRRACTSNGKTWIVVIYRYQPKSLEKVFMPFDGRKSDMKDYLLGWDSGLLFLIQQEIIAESDALFLTLNSKMLYSPPPVWSLLFV